MADNELELSTPEERLANIALVKSQLERIDRILNDPNLLDVICSNVSNGGSLISLCKLWGIPYGDLTNFIRKNKHFDERYQRALKDRSEWAAERYLLELRQIGLMDIKGIYDQLGAIKPPHEWPDDISAAVTSLEVDELYETQGDERVQIGVTKKVKFSDKIKSIELLGKNLRLFIERAELSGTLKLEDLVSLSFNRSIVGGSASDQNK